MPKNHRTPDTRYGGKPIYDHMSGFDLTDAPCVEGEIILIKDNRKKIIKDLATLNGYLREARKYFPGYPFLHKLKLDNTSLICMKQHQKLKNGDLPKFPVSVTFKIFGHLKDKNFNVDYYAKGFASSDSETRFDLQEDLFYKLDLYDWRSRIDLQYFADGTIGAADVGTWGHIKDKSVRFNMNLRTVKDELVLTRTQVLSEDSKVTTFQRA